MTLHEYTFKIDIANGLEHYEYSTDAPTWLERGELERSRRPAVIKKDFPFPESFLVLLYLDISESTRPFANSAPPKTSGMCGSRWRVWTSWPASMYTLN